MGRSQSIEIPLSQDTEDVLLGQIKLNYFLLFGIKGKKFLIFSCTLDDWRSFDLLLRRLHLEKQLQLETSSG